MVEGDRKFHPRHSWGPPRASP